jgi:hypothetical protein
MRVVRRITAPVVLVHQNVTYYQIEGATLDTPITVGQAFYQTMIIVQTIPSVNAPLKERMKFVSKTYYYITK